MNEDSARQVTLLQAFETAQPASPNWTDDDRAWASRLALQEGSADAPTFIARRAQHAMRRLLPREPGAAKWLARRSWQWRWVGWAVLAGVSIGVLADSIGSSQRINLLAPPLWALLVWNAVVYLLLLGHGLAGLLMRKTRPGSLVRLTQRVLRFGRGLAASGNATASASASASGSAPALRRFANLWLRCSAPLSAARAATLLHAAAAALALGLIAGLYLRGLVLDYRAAWQSTFLSAASAHAFLAVVLAPAVALSGIPLPDAAGFEALRSAPGSAPGSELGSAVGSAFGSAAPGASAAPWIHLMALTLLGFVVLPRGGLALAGAGRARWLARHVELPPGDAYFRRLTNQLSGNTAQVVVLPYASTPSPQAALGLRALLAPVLGAGLQLQIAPTTAFGAEDSAAAPIAPGTTLVIALFDLTATPEADSQGRFVQQLAARAPAGAATLVLIDEAAFKLRFRDDAQRLAQRRDAWRGFAEGLGSVPVFGDLAAPDPAAGMESLQPALRSPVSRAAA